MYKLLYLRSTLTSCRSPHSRSHRPAIIFRLGRANAQWQSNWMVFSLQTACSQLQEMRTACTEADTLHAFWEQSPLRLKSVDFMPLNWDAVSQMVYANPGPCCWWKGWFKASPLVCSTLSTLVSAICVQPGDGLNQTIIPTLLKLMI